VNPQIDDPCVLACLQVRRSAHSTEKEKVLGRTTSSPLSPESQRSRRLSGIRFGYFCPGGADDVKM
jgi:hypothetical protein